MISACVSRLPGQAPQRDPGGTPPSGNPSTTDYPTDRRGQARAEASAREAACRLSLLTGAKAWQFKVLSWPINTVEPGLRKGFCTCSRDR